MTRDTEHIARITTKLGQLWMGNPHLSLGQLIEKVEDAGWARFEQAMQRECSARLMNPPDAYLEAGLDSYLISK